MSAMETQTYKTILVGVDGSEQANLAYKWAIGVAKRNQGQVIIVHVIENKLYTMMGYSTMKGSLIGQETEAAKEILND